MRGSLATLERLSQIFPEDIGLKNDLGVAHLLLGDNKGAKKVYEEVCVCVCVRRHLHQTHTSFHVSQEFVGVEATFCLHCLSLYL